MTKPAPAPSPVNEQLRNFIGGRYEVVRLNSIEDMSMNIPAQPIDEAASTLEFVIDRLIDDFQKAEPEANAFPIFQYNTNLHPFQDKLHEKIQTGDRYK